jgi:hypothetical protein
MSLSSESDGLARGKSVITLATVFWDVDGEIGGAVAPHESLREPCRVGPAEAALTPQKYVKDNSIHRFNFDREHSRLPQKCISRQG